MSDERHGFTITWNIENFSFTWQTNKAPLYSPEFHLDKMESTKWSLGLYWILQPKRHIRCYLFRRFLDDGPVFFEVDYELAILANDRSHVILKDCCKRRFSKNTASLQLTVNSDDILGQKRDAFLPQDILTVRCTLWKTGLFSTEAGRCFARTRVEVERRSFFAIFGEFSELKAGQVKPFQIRSTSAENSIISMNIVLTEDPRSKQNISIEVIPISGQFLKSSFLQIFLLDVSGSRESCGKFEHQFKERAQNEVWRLPLPLDRNYLLNRKRDFLPNDVLTLQCEFACSTGIESQMIEKTECGPHSSVDGCCSNAKINCSDLSKALQSDLKTLYIDGFLCDAKIRIGTETFPVHRTILSARSPVFRAMFTSDVREKTSGCIDIEDLGADTVRRMLLFMYTTILEDLQWEDSKELYFAADKYQISSLKLKCSSFLKEHLDSSNCCDVLVLADMHRDGDLKEAAQKYILEHDREVFLSNEWNAVEKNHTFLALEVMRLVHLHGRKK